jgi:retinol dehydrogenase-12
MGAYTLLFAAFSPLVTASHNGKFITAWGRFADVRPDLRAEIEKGESGNGAKLWEWCETEIAKYSLP